MYISTVFKWLLFFWVVCLSTASSLWLTAPRALVNLASSASATASKPDDTVSHIADLRRRQEKSLKLQEEENKEESGGEITDERDEENNEASPSLLQKKVSKILTKLKFIAQIKNAVHSTPNDENTNPNSDENAETNTTEADELQGADKVIAEKVNQQNNDTKKITEEPKDMATYNIYSQFRSQKKLDTFSDMMVESLKKLKTLYNAPQRIDLDVNGRIINEKNKETLESSELTQETNGDDSDTSSKIGQIGVFFTELIGMLVGLAYGAAAQISNSQAQNNAGII